MGGNCPDEVVDRFVRLLHDLRMRERIDALCNSIVDEGADTDGVRMIEVDEVLASAYRLKKGPQLVIPQEAHRRHPVGVGKYACVKAMRDDCVASRNQPCQFFGGLAAGCEAHTLLRQAG